MLDVENEYLQANLKLWSRLYPNRWVLIRGRQLIGTYATIEEVRAAREKLGGGLVLVRQLHRSGA